ncbi:MAG: hypothetical protein GYB65_06250 [Chloroflexi bacterium]|nr:hypothetical protein [Chloroflexota bacterium]
MYIEAIHTELIERDQSLFRVLQDNLSTPLKERTIVCVTSKVVALEQGRLARLVEITPSAQAQEIQELRFSEDSEPKAEFAELVLREADRVFVDMNEPGYVFLTLKDNVLVANAGIDLSNVPSGYAVLWPDDPWTWARDFREKLRVHYNLQDVGVLVTDSHVKPLRRGVTGVAIGYSGFVGIRSEIGHLDIFGKPLKFTEIAVADSLAAVAVFMMGESAEQTPFALIKDPPVTFTEALPTPAENYFAPKFDLYAPLYTEHFRTSE